MGIIVKGETIITRDFQTWKKMVYSKNNKLGEHGIKLIFAGPQKQDPTKLHGIMQFPNMKAIQAFGTDDELTAKRIGTGAVIESGIMTPIAKNYFTNYQDTHIKY